MSRIGSCDIGQFVQGQPEDTETCPAPARAGKHPVLCVCRIPPSDTRSQLRRVRSARYLIAIQAPG